MPPKRSTVDSSDSDDDRKKKNNTKKAVDSSDSSDSETERKKKAIKDKQKEKKRSRADSSSDDDSGTENKKKQKTKKDSESSDDESELKPGYRWQWVWKGDPDSKGNEVWIEFDDELTQKIEKRFLKNKEKVKIDKERFVDLSNKKQFFQRRFDDPDKRRLVKRVQVKIKKSKQGSEEGEERAAPATPSKSSKSSSSSSSSSSPSSSSSDSNYDNLRACDSGGMCVDKSEAHRKKYTHPCPYGIDCYRQGNLNHANTESHPCPNGIKCSLFRKGDQGHMAKFDHPPPKLPCPKEEKDGACTKMDPKLNAIHHSKYVHQCQYGPACNWLKKPGTPQANQHIRAFTHPCPYGKDCPDVKKDEHLSQYNHKGPGTLKITSKIIPDYWKDWDHDKKNLIEVELANDPKCKKEVADLVAKMQKTGVKINQVVSCRRVQNFRMWLQYWAAKQRVEERAINKGKNVEQHLFHGCRTTANLTEIITNGFDQQCANSNPYGVWFAEQSSYSWGGYVIAHPDGSKEIIIARVVTGTPGDDDGSGRRAYTSKNSGVLADCQTHKQMGGNIFVVYRSEQCYPEYILRGK